MICTACNYSDSFWNKEGKITPKEKTFIHIKHSGHYGLFYDNSNEIQIYACPICGTLRMEEK